jgi:hypothetical protein
MTFARQVPAAVVGLLWISCAQRPPPREPAATIASPPGSSTAPPLNPQQAELAAAKQVNEMLLRMARLRSLPATGSVSGRVIDRATMIAQLKKHVQEEIPPEALRGQGEFLRAFGFIPKNYDFERGLYGLIESQLAGYYDPDAKAMFLMNDLPPKEADATLAHELVHALQDQHYDLGPKMKYRADVNDEQSALQSLAEGDATSAMLDYVLVPEGKTALDVPDLALELQISGAMALSPEVAQVPRILKSSLVSPYIDGVKFVGELRRRGGWPAVDRAWNNLPVTTEQLLHVDKFDRREPAESVPVPGAGLLGADWRATYWDVYGEQGLRVALEEWLPKRLAAAAAQGWAGDHAMVAVRHATGRDEVAAAWRIRFDPGAPPQGRSAEALEAFRAIVSQWDPTAATSGRACTLLPDGTPIAARTRDRDVVLTAGAGLMALQPGKSACDAAIGWANDILASP